jgi:hypothetical protein
VQLELQSKKNVPAHQQLDEVVYASKADGARPSSRKMIILSKEQEKTYCSALSVARWHFLLESIRRLCYLSAFLRWLLPAPWSAFMWFGRARGGPGGGGRT